MRTIIPGSAIMIIVNDVTHLMRADQMRPADKLAASAWSKINESQANQSA